MRKKNDSIQLIPYLKMQKKLKFSNTTRDKDIVTMMNTIANNPGFQTQQDICP